MTVIRLYLVGLFVLFGAIVANVIAAKLHLKSWYDLLIGLSETPSYWSQLGVKNLIWLLIIYPFLLGLSAFLGNLISQKFFSL